MKGIVFTEFMEMVESKFGYELADQLIEENDLPSQGVYTAVGTYDYSEMVTLLTDLNERTEIPIPQLLYTFGEYLFQTFATGYEHFFKYVPDAFTFFESIDNHIHVEVLKLYPEAQLPKFKTQRINENSLEMVYESSRKMADFAHGLIDATLEHFTETATVEQTKIENGGAVVHFLITKK